MSLTNRRPLFIFLGLWRKSNPWQNYTTLTILISGGFPLEKPAGSSWALKQFHLSISFTFTIFPNFSSTRLAAHKHTQGVTICCSKRLMWLGIGENTLACDRDINHGHYLKIKQFKQGMALWRPWDTSCTANNGLAACLSQFLLFSTNHLSATLRPLIDLWHLDVPVL